MPFMTAAESQLLNLIQLALQHLLEQMAFLFWTGAIIGAFASFCVTAILLIVLYLVFLAPRRRQ